jgi:hypothetical protein
MHKQISLKTIPVGSRKNYSFGVAAESIFRSFLSISLAVGLGWKGKELIEVPEDLLSLMLNCFLSFQEILQKRQIT